jgi:hypothetical protein
MKSIYALALIIFAAASAFTQESPDAAKSVLSIDQPESLVGASLDQLRTSYPDECHKLKPARYAGEAKPGSLQSCIVKQHLKVAGSTVKREVLFIKQGRIIEANLFFFGTFRGSVPGLPELRALYGTPEPPGQSEPHVYGGFGSYTYDNGAESTTLDNRGESHHFVTIWTRPGYTISWSETLSESWQEVGEDNPIGDLLHELMHTTKGDSMGHLTFEFKLTAASATDQDRQDYSVGFNEATRVNKRPDLHSSVDGKRFIIHYQGASRQYGKLLLSKEDFLGDLRSNGFRKLVLTNDADRTFELDIPGISAAGSEPGPSPALPESVKQELTANSEAAKSSPAAAASLARVGRVYTPQELADLVQEGQASRLAVITNPSGAEIYVDGNKAGISPMATTLLRYGDTPRVITIKMSGYTTVEKSFVPDGKVIPIGLNLEKEPQQ